jgi:lantibiotic leader peptide-processing serine protease
MKRIAPMLLAGAAVLAACTDDAVDDITAVSGTPAALAVAESDNGQYLVRLRGNTRSFTSSVEALGGTVMYMHGGASFAVVTGLTGAAAGRLAGAAAVTEVQPDAEISLSLPHAPMTATLDEIGIASQANPATSIRYSWQWNLRAMGAQHAWAAGKLGSPDVTVAILDTGLDYTSLDANGLVDLSRSASFVASDNALRAQFFPSRHDIDDFNGHGTNVASQVSTIGFAHAGVTSMTRLMGVKVLSARGSGSTAGVLMGVLHAVDNGADVINLSLGGAFTRAGGGGTLMSMINQVFNYANRHGVLIVVAAGNDGNDLDRNIFWDGEDHRRYGSAYAAYCDATHVICVAATGPVLATGNADLPAVYTNFGRSAISVAAPGGNIGTAVSIWPWGAHIASWVWSMCPINYLSNPANPAIRPCASGGAVNGYIGTSQAAPHVAGLAALLVAEMGKGKPAQIKARIQQTADPMGVSGNDPYFGKGRVNVARALGL